MTALSGEVKTKRNRIAFGVTIAMVMVVADFSYKTINGINYLNRSKCFLSSILPETGFLLFEYFVEIPMLVLVTIFLSAVIEKHLLAYRKYVPANPVTAFCYASVLPVCSCAALPMVITLQGRMRMRVLMTFLLAAPLLNPYIIFVSFSVLGVRYGLLRIAAAFVLSVSAGYLFEWGLTRTGKSSGPGGPCPPSGCSVAEDDVFLKTFALFKSMIPFLLIGGLAAAALTYALPAQSLSQAARQSNSVWGNLVIILVGIPFYLCNGADVILLNPLICSGMQLGTAMAVSLTVTSVCITSMIMLFRFFGAKFSLLLIAHIVVVTLAISQGVNYLFWGSQ